MSAVTVLPVLAGVFSLSVQAQERSQALNLLQGGVVQLSIAVWLQTTAAWHEFSCFHVPAKRTRVCLPPRLCSDSSFAGLLFSFSLQQCGLSRQTFSCHCMHYAFNVMSNNFSPFVRAADPPEAERVVTTVICHNSNSTSVQLCSGADIVRDVLIWRSIIPL